MEKLSSKDNSMIKNCRNLAANANERREQGLIFVEGLRLCCEAAAAGAVVQQLLLTEDALERWMPQLTPLLESAEETALVSKGLGEHLSQTQNSQGVYAVCRAPRWVLPDLAQGGRYLLLDRLQDPGNLGTIIRTAEAFGMTAVVLSPHCADPWSPKVLRGTMGSCFRQCVVQVPDIGEILCAMGAAGVTAYAAALEPSSVTPAQMQPGTGGIAVVIGNEGAGVSPELLACIPQRVYIPMTPHIESLNAATAASVLMWELSGKGLQQ